MAVKDIKDLLLEIQKGNTTKHKPMKSIREIWEMIGNKASLEEMGFANESEKRQWMEENPYDF